MKNVYHCIIGAHSCEILDQVAFTAEVSKRYKVVQQVSLTGQFLVKGAKFLRKLEVGEVLDGLGEKTREPNTGIFRMHCRTQRDGLEGYVSVAGNQGTSYLEENSRFSLLQSTFELAARQFDQIVKETTFFLKKKLEGLLGTPREGPLAVAKVDIGEMLQSVGKIQQLVGGLKTRIDTAQQRFEDAVANEKLKREEAQEQKSANVVFDGVDVAIEKVQADAAVAFNDLVVQPSTGGSLNKNPLEELDRSQEALAQLNSSIDAANILLKDRLDVVKNATKGPQGDVRSTLVKHKALVVRFLTKSKKRAAELALARNTIGSDAHAVMANALVTHARDAVVTAAALFDKLRNSEDDVSVHRFKAFLLSIRSDVLKVWQIDCGLERYGERISKFALFSLLDQYFKCLKEITMTTELSLKLGTTVRKLKAGEVVEFIGATEHESSSGLSRVQCRAVIDGKTGYLTIKGNHGTAFLEPVRRPYYRISGDTSLYSGFEASSSLLRAANVGEICGVVEGPRHEQATQMRRVKCTAKSDGQTGWVTLHSTDGTDCLARADVLTVVKLTAITLNFDISGGKAVRKIEVGEALTALGEERVDEKRKLTRARVRAVNDGTEGWVTLKGNQGTAYVEAASLYKVKSGMPLDASKDVGGAYVRQLQAGEAVSYSGEPVMVSMKGVSRVKVFSLLDGAEGWFPDTPATYSSWSGRYSCSTDESCLCDRIASSDCTTIRKLERGEALEALAAPTVCESVVRVLVRAEKDGKVGFVTEKDSSGVACLATLL